jgi:hypothetical protein
MVIRDANKITHTPPLQRRALRWPLLLATRQMLEVNELGRGITKDTLFPISTCVPQMLLTE